MDRIGTLLLDSQTLIDIGGGGKRLECVSIYIRHGAAMTTQIPTQSVDIYLVAFVEITTTATAAFLLSVNEAAATVYATSGIKPEVISMASVNAATPIMRTIAKNTSMWVSSDAATNMLLIFEREAPSENA